MSDLEVLVVGASIAGPAAAYWLARAGANVTVIERFPELRMGGQSIDIRTAGVTVMRKMDGMEAAVRAKSTGQEGVEFVGCNGRVAASLKAMGDADRQSLVSEYEIFRGDLARILYDMTRHSESIRYIFGEYIVSMQHEDDGVTLEFANGLPTFKYDLVVACDGATSRTRAMGLDCGVRDHITPLNAWAAYFSVSQDLLGGSKDAQLYSAIGGRALGIGPDPSGKNRVGLICINGDATRQYREVAKAGDKAMKQFITEHYKSAGWKTEQLIQGMNDAKDFYTSEIVQVKLPQLSRGRFVLVGDAGYCPSPFTGAGTTLALAGAYVLAGEVARHRHDLATGLQRYEKRMRPIIDDLQPVSSVVPLMLAPQTAWGIWIRNLVMKVIGWTSALSWLGKYFSSSFGSDKYGLPDYQWTR